MKRLFGRRQRIVIVGGRELCRCYSHVSTTLQKKKKRKVAISLGFNGVDFRGSQFQGDAFRTVEGELEKALCEIGCIRDSNAGDISKIGWSRSSRTDKGVSARVTTVALKILVSDDAVFDNHGHAKSVVSELNETLPKDIRVFSVVKASRSFNARMACTYRDYRYFVPTSLFPLPDSSSSSEFTSKDMRAKAAADALGRCLIRFRGTTNFANFTQLKDALRENKKMTGRDVESLVAADPDALPKASTLIRTLYQSTVTSYDQDFLELRFAGQGFLYNQIRLIVGLSIGVALGIIPEKAIDFAFQRLLPRNCVPLAPGFPLVAHSCAFRPQSHVLLEESHRLATFGFKSAPKSHYPDIDDPRILLLESDSDDGTGELVDAYFRDNIFPSLVEDPNAVATEDSGDNDDDTATAVARNFGWEQFRQSLDVAANQFETLEMAQPQSERNEIMSPTRERFDPYVNRPRGLVAAVSRKIRHYIINIVAFVDVSGGSGVKGSKAQVASGKVGGSGSDKYNSPIAIWSGWLNKISLKARKWGRKERFFRLVRVSVQGGQDFFEIRYFRNDEDRSAENRLGTINLFKAAGVCWFGNYTKSEETACIICIPTPSRVWFLKGSKIEQITHFMTKLSNIVPQIAIRAHGIVEFPRKQRFIKMKSDWKRRYIVGLSNFQMLVFNNDKMEDYEGASLLSNYTTVQRDRDDATGRELLTCALRQGAQYERTDGSGKMEIRRRRRRLYFATHKRR
eukprot:g4965.t1